MILLFAACFPEELQMLAGRKKGFPASTAA
jgi:hypothetical protein